MVAYSIRLLIRKLHSGTTGPRMSAVGGLRIEAHLRLSDARLGQRAASLLRGPCRSNALYEDSIGGLLGAGDFDFHAAIRLQTSDQCLGRFVAFAFTGLRHRI